MITRNQLEIRYHSLLKKRLYYLRKLKESPDPIKYNNLIVKLNNTESVLALFESGLRGIKHG